MRPIKAPVIVLDWNLIQSMPTYKDVPDYSQCVVPAHVLHEIATKEVGEDRGAMTKLFRWGSKNAHRLWIGRITEHLFEEQVRSRGARLTIQDIVEPRQTQLWRRILRTPNLNTELLLAKLKNAPPVKLRNHQNSELVRFSDAIVKAWGKRPMKRIPLPEEKADWVQLPQLATDLVETQFPKWWRPEWRQYIHSDPHRFAVIRWARFLAWYFVKRAEGQTKKFVNNFDDAHYGFLASYAGHLGTHDKGLAEATQAIFPSLRVLRLDDLQTTGETPPAVTKPAA